MRVKKYPLFLSEDDIRFEYEIHNRIGSCKQKEKTE